MSVVSIAVLISVFIVTDCLAATRWRNLQHQHEDLPETNMNVVRPSSSVVKLTVLYIELQ